MFLAWILESVSYVDVDVSPAQDAHNLVKVNEACNVLPQYTQWKNPFHQEAMKNNNHPRDIAREVADMICRKQVWLKI